MERFDPLQWAHPVPAVQLDVACGSQQHRLCWQGGKVTAPAHPDLDAEAALMALGGERVRCVELVADWQRAVADGGFLAEWAEMDLDDRVYRHHLRVAMSRLRLEGVQDLLRGLHPARAEAMGRFLLAFPQAWVDRAALAVIVAGRNWAGSEPRQAAVARALQVRARSAFVASLARHAATVRPAALVRFSCQVGPWGCPPAADGMLDGTSSWCRVTLGPNWLAEVWGRGQTLDPAGDLLLAEGGTALRWERGEQGSLYATVHQRGD